MEITHEFLSGELEKMKRQHQHAHEVAIASQAAIDVLSGLLARLELPEKTTEEGDLTFEDLGLPDPEPITGAVPCGQLQSHKPEPDQPN